MYPSQHIGEADPFVLYAKSLHDYTLKLWTESIRVSEERGRGRMIAKPSRRKSDMQRTNGQTQSMDTAA
ncbi:uncharacterized protein PHACADRAFT_247891 [Phanerochaete carnosa HHB-10118-sp]|uniref:Uncharacterized protein n=1 Tax=Phanerochaete carnosa (strain HHB-10118-sp) TaxID=650164 RepID=K5WBP6_PHACS|nr:uncharacterized protein PHACADRAFT_247891 [Phanerochaete carnosa HHB-10118-sp]EKM61348.1 hypothetical protein PHACADRAFT_247891 [Phanerochaete carnosa HHB-10118-sp]